MLANRHSVSSRSFVPTIVNAAILSQMFGREPTPGGLYLPTPEFQAVAADVDGDGDDDKYAIRIMPLTDASGKALADAGGTAEIEFEPLKWVQILNFVFVEDHAGGVGITNFVIGQDPQFPSKGLVPALSFQPDNGNSLIDVPWCGPGVPLSLSLKNITTGAKTFYGAARVRAIIG